MAISDYNATESENKTVPGTPAIEIGKAVNSPQGHSIQTQAIQRIMADLKSANYLSGSAPAAVRALLDLVVYVDDRTALKELDGSLDTVAFLNDEHRTAIFDPSDLSAEVTADSGETLYVAPTSDATGASGAWKLAVDNSYFLDGRPTPYVHAVSDWIRSIRRLEEFSPGVDNPPDWGAILNLAFGPSELPASGGTLLLDARTYTCTTEAQLDLSHVTNFFLNRSINIEGKGSGVTQIISAHTGAAINIVDGKRGIPKLNMKGFMLFRQGAAQTGTGLKGTDIAFASFEDINIRGFDQGVELYDIISSKFTRCHWAGNNKGGTLGYVAWSPAYDLLFDSCEVSLNDERGLEFIRAGGVVMIGGGCQYNGKAATIAGGGGSYGGHLVSSVAPLGKTTVLQIIGTHFEGNVGTGGDLQVVNGAQPVRLDIAAKFHRPDQTYITDNCIRLDLNNGGNLLCDFEKSIFTNYGAWTPSSATAFIREFGSSGSAIMLGREPYYENFTEAWNLKHSAMPVARVRFNGTTVGTQTGTYKNNVSQVERLATGRYRVTMINPGRSSTWQVTGTVNGKGAIQSPIAATADTVTFDTFDTATGALTDYSNVFVSIFN